MEWWGYTIVLLSLVSSILGWVAKLRWSAEYKNAKEETIKSKDAHIALLEREVKNLQELTPMKMREYLVTTKQSLEEYNDSLQKEIEEIREERVAYEQQIRCEADQIVAGLKRSNSRLKQFNEAMGKTPAAIEGRRNNDQDGQIS